MTKHKYNYIDLCCGIGGFRVGVNEFEKQYPQYKFKCVLSADIKPDAIVTYNENFNEENCIKDIYDIDTIPKFDILFAGFSCQSFSTAGCKKGFDDKRGKLIFEIHKICKKYKPSIIVLENVNNLITLEKGKLLKKIVSMFEELKYNITYKLLDSSNFGIPQSRKRVYIIGSLDKEVDLENIPNIKDKTLNDIIDHNEAYTDIDQEFADKLIQLHTTKHIYGFKLQDKRGGNDNIHSWDLGLNGNISDDEKLLMNKIMTERRKKHWAEKKKIVWMDGMPLTCKEISTFFKRDNLQELLNNLVDKKYLKLEKCKDLINKKRVYKEDSEEGYNICKGKLSFPISKILDPNGISPTLTATDSHKLVFLINDKFIRKITDNEIKLICGFPTTFKIPKNVDKYDLFGNMVTPPVVTEILKRIFIV